MKKTAFKNGYTLVELLITCGMFLVVLTVLSFILVNNVRYLKKGEAETEQVKSLRSSLYYMVKTLTESDRIYNYNDSNWSTNIGASSGASQIVFNYRGKMCTFAYNSGLKEIEYFEYSGYPGATPYPANLTVTPGSRRPISLRVGSIRGVIFKIEDPANPKMITIEETANPAFTGGQVFTMRVKVLIR